MIDSGEALLVAARAGMGVLLQPCELVQEDLDKGLLLPDYPVWTRPFYLMYAPDRRMTQKLRSFIDFAIATNGTENLP